MTRTANWGTTPSAKVCKCLCFKSSCSLEWRGLRTEEQLHLRKCVSASVLSHPAHWNDEDCELRNNLQGAETWSFRTVSHSSCPFPLPSPTYHPVKNTRPRIVLVRHGLALTGHRNNITKQLKYPASIPSLISLVVFVDVKHHVYLPTYPTSHSFFTV